MEDTELSKGFKEAVARWLRDTKGLDAKEVTSWDEWISSGYGCDTCGPEYEVEVTIYYKDSTGKSQSYRHYGQFGYLLTDLLAA